MTAKGSVRLASLAVLALLIGLWSIRTFAPAAPAVAPPPNRQTAAEQPRALDASRAEGEAARSGELAADAWRQDQLARLRPEAASPSEPGSATSADDGPSRAGEPPARSTRSPNWERWFDAEDFDETELLAGGMPSGEVERLRGLSEEIESERVGITQQAEHEGWRDDRRYRNEMVEFERATQQKIGDDSYDALLYATGRENRVSVRAVLENSAGRSFGLQEGDILLRYDDQLIFRATDLRKVTSKGVRGQLVPVEVLRNNQVVQLQGPLGHLKARYQPTRVLPDALW